MPVLHAEKSTQENSMECAAKEIGKKVSAEDVTLHQNFLNELTPMMCPSTLKTG